MSDLNELVRGLDYGQGASLLAYIEDLHGALSMLWTYYLLPISDEQKAQVRVALGEETSG